MKPKNFPGRKNMRRIRALQRMVKPGESETFMHEFNRHTIYFDTKAKTITPEEARSIKTKKLRG